MKGAREFARLFATGRYGRLSIRSGQHARGYYFHIFVMAASGEDAVEVYGVTSGQPGWTETYGWLHRGKWEEDFMKLVEERKVAILAAVAEETKEKLEAEAKRHQREKELLSTY